MTVAHDAATQFTGTTSPDSGSHTPVGTPRSVVVFTVGNADSATISATYGGVAMTHIASASFVDGFHLGASIPTGTQTAEITYTTATAMRVAVLTSTAAADTEVTVFNSLSATQANPQLTLNTGATEALRYCGIRSGVDALASLVLLSGMTELLSADIGAEVRRFDVETTASSGSFTIGYTAASDIAQLVAMAVQEIAGAATAAPYPYIGGGYYPTEG